MVKIEQKQNKLKWITVIGIGEDGLDGLTSHAKQLLKSADHIFGGARHLALLSDNKLNAILHVWPKPLLLAIDQIKLLKGQSVVILASGDPMHFGVGATLVRYFSIDEIDVIANPSSFSLAASRLGWALQDVECLSIHGRPIEGIVPAFQDNAKLLILSNDGESIWNVSKLLVERGFSNSSVTLLENLGGHKERQFSNTASSINQDNHTITDISDLNVLAVECHKDRSTIGLSRFASLPDCAFEHDGQITKQDIRAVTMAHLSPQLGETLWDIGAGCGSISIEWMRTNNKMKAIAVERNADRCQLIRKNAFKLGAADLEIVNAEAPDALRNLKQPDAIFIGGGFTDNATVEYCWDALKSGGRLIANTVTLESEALAQKYANAWQGRLIKIAVSSAEPLGRFHTWRTALPITILICEK